MKRLEIFAKSEAVAQVFSEHPAFGYQRVWDEEVTAKWFDNVVYAEGHQDEEFDALQNLCGDSDIWDLENAEYLNGDSVYLPCEDEFYCYLPDSLRCRASELIRFYNRAYNYINAEHEVE